MLRHSPAAVSTPRRKRCHYAGCAIAIIPRPHTMPVKLHRAAAIRAMDAGSCPRTRQAPQLRRPHRALLSQPSAPVPAKAALRTYISAQESAARQKSGGANRDAFRAERSVGRALPGGALRNALSRAAEPAYHSATTPSDKRHTGFFQSWPISACRRTLSSSISMPRPGPVSSGTVPAS